MFYSSEQKPNVKIGVSQRSEASSSFSTCKFHHFNTRIFNITYYEQARCLYLRFLGCNYRCIFCINKLSIYDTHLPDELLKILERLKISFVSSKELLNILNTYNVDKVVLGGGEPLLDPNICSIVSLLKDFNIRIILLTNCYILDERMELLEMLDKDDTVVVSIKSVDPVKHRVITGKSLRRVVKNLLMLYNKHSVSVKVETVFVPGLVDVFDIVTLAKWIEENMPDAELIVDSYIPVPELPYSAPTEKDFEKLLQELSKISIRVSLRRPSKVETSGKVVCNGKIVLDNYKTSDTIHLVHPVLPEGMLAPHT